MYKAIVCAAFIVVETMRHSDLSGKNSASRLAPPEKTYTKSQSSSALRSKDAPSSSKISSEKQNIDRTARKSKKVSFASVRSQPVLPPVLLTDLDDEPQTATGDQPRALQKGPNVSYKLAQLQPVPQPAPGSDRADVLQAIMRDRARALEYSASNVFVRRMIDAEPRAHFRVGGAWNDVDLLDVYISIRSDHPAALYSVYREMGGRDSAPPNNGEKDTPHTVSRDVFTAFINYVLFKKIAAAVVVRVDEAPPRVDLRQLELGAMQMLFQPPVETMSQSMVRRLHQRGMLTLKRQVKFVDADVFELIQRIKHFVQGLFENDSKV